MKHLDVVFSTKYLHFIVGYKGYKDFFFLITDALIIGCSKRPC